ncbi:mechanosensitive ion channel family protein [Verrucomicrobiales bacterium]|nr:mechanosensitive ion channel family protein [Verrucomicrobiales bacterium]
MSDLADQGSAEIIIEGEISPADVVPSAIIDSTASISKSVFGWVKQWGVPEWLESPIATSILLVGVVIISLLLLVIVRPIMLRLVTKAIEKTKVKWDNYLLWNGLPRWASHFVCGLLIFAVIPGLFKDTPELAKWLVKAAQIYMVIAAYFIIDSVINTAKALYKKTDLAKKMPTSSFVQLAKVIASLFAIILVIAILAGKSPLTLIAGFGVLASVLMFVFKDPILGFVSGLQLVGNKLIAPGDWIEMKKYGIDGDVLDVGMTTVKVKNFDNTITTIPTQVLINDSFKNWRAMQESGGRRIKRTLNIDVRSVKFCTDWMLKVLGELQLITEHVDAKIKEVDDWNEENGADLINQTNGRQLTNLGMYRAYIEAYLDFNPNISKEMTVLVRQLQPTELGLPIEIYCFTTTTNWNEYEAIQCDLFDHLIAATKEFELEIFQLPTRFDTETVVNMNGGRLDHAALK